MTYLTSPTHQDRTERYPPPVVLRGHPAFVARLIDSLDFTHKYTSGVLSFAPGEKITPAMETAVMDAFERVAFAGLSRDRYAILWVRHTHAGHHEMNFLIPRAELVTGKSLNVAPPVQASRELFDTFRSWVNATYGLADPDNPRRAQDVKLPNHAAKRQAESTRKGSAKDEARTAITEAVRREVDAGHITNRDGVEKHLRVQGYTLSRVGTHYLSVEIDPTLPASRGRVRLEGGLYDKEHWNPREAPTAQAIRYDAPDPDRAAALSLTLERLAAARAAYHHARYGAREEAPPERRQAQEPPELDAYLHTTLGTDAIEPWTDGPSPLQRRRERRYEALRIELEETQEHGTDRSRSRVTGAPG